MLLLDTDIMVDVLRGRDSATAWLASHRTEQIALVGFVVMELIDGCANAAEQRRIEAAIAGMTIIWPDQTTCEVALSRFSQLHLSAGIGYIDCLIGQTAVTVGEPLHTFNSKHYRVIPNLQLVQPYQR